MGEWIDWREALRGWGGAAAFVAVWWGLVRLAVCAWGAWR